MKLAGKLLLVFAWMPLALGGLFASLYTFHKYSTTKDMDKLIAMQQKALSPKSGVEFYAALPQVLGAFSTAVTKEDARPEILKAFLQKHESPMEEYAQTIVEASDANEVDYRLITAIGMCESNVGKKIPPGSYNAWGYAVYTGEQSGAVFNDWSHGIWVMAQYLQERYLSKGLTSPYEMGPIYAPPSVNTGNSWAKCVSAFMEELR